MIHVEKHVAALGSIHGVMVWARSLAYQHADHRELVRILDQAEYLLTLVMDPGDQTEHFRACLVDLAEEFRIPYVLQRFDGAEARA